MIHPERSTATMVTITSQSAAACTSLRAKNPTLISIIVSRAILALPLLLFTSNNACSVAQAQTQASSPLPTDRYGDYDGSDIIEWIRSHPDGIIHPSLRIGREIPGDSTSLLGLFVKSSADDPQAKPIEKGEVIAQIPWDHMIHPGNKYAKYRYFSCRSIYSLAKELRLGDKSTRAPYVRYLLSQPRGTMPGEWTKAGQEFFAEVLGHGDLPPYEDTWRTHYTREWIEGCSGSDSIQNDGSNNANTGNDDNDDDASFERAAFWLTSSRDEDTLMIPVYDMANHSNDPDKLNTLSYKPESAGGVFRFIASKTIPLGGQVYNSYNRCNQCSNVPASDCETFSFYRTPDLFVTFGFVEDYPQNWEFDPAHHHRDEDDSSDDEEDTEFDFCLHRNPKSGKLDVYWDEDSALDARDLRWLKKQRQRLMNLSDSKDSIKEKLVHNVDDTYYQQIDKMTQWEWESIWRYHQALVDAIIAVIDSDKYADEL